MTGQQDCNAARRNSPQKCAGISRKGVIVIKALLSGNEAIARGAYEGGVRAASAYPGTPSTEILETLATYPEVYCEWAPNEKVAVEVAQGASFAGARVLCAMKHVGVNVAADPLFSLAYTGVNGGFVVVSADDPGMHSSQNEQDNRYYAKFLKIPLLEPSDSQEAKDFVLAALAISEQFTVPVLVRSTTRISHAKSVVEIGARQTPWSRTYKKNVTQRVVIPAHARQLRRQVEARLTSLAAFSEQFPGNRVEGEGTEFAVITSGIAYQYAREALGDRATYLKLSLTYPLPRRLITDFIAAHDRVYVIEEGEPFLEEQIAAMGFKVIGKQLFPIIGELSASVIREKMLGSVTTHGFSAVDVPVRPPVLCPGCPHRGVYFVLNKIGAIVTGDIGCYSLAVMPPLATMETCICMGASIGNALGLAKMLPEKKVVATIGDSTFIHSGITGLIDVVYNKGVLTVVILDNGITGMTGHQHHPGTGYTIKGEKTTALDLVAMVRACGIQHVWVVNAYDLGAVEEALRAATSCGQPAVVITRQPCVLKDKTGRKVPLTIEQQVCRQCRACLHLGCPALEYTGEQVNINATLCSGCGVCQQICPFKAIQAGDGNEQ